MKLGDEVLLYSGEVVNVEKVDEEQLDKAVKVYNFEVEDWHTYFVSNRDVLVHNDCAAPHGIDYTSRGVTKYLFPKNKSAKKSGVEALKKRFLESNYVKVGKGKWRNRIGTRQFRAKPNDLNHAKPHVHIEFLQKTHHGYLVRRNYHVKYKK